jgi:hypothetical protein
LFSDRSHAAEATLLTLLDSSSNSTAAIPIVGVSEAGQRTRAVANTSCGLQKAI